MDTGVFQDNRYYDVFAEYAKNSPNDILIRLTVVNRGPETATLHLLPTIWFRNTWIWGCTEEGCTLKPRIALEKENLLLLEHETLKRYFFEIGLDPKGKQPELLFTDNETNLARLFNAANAGPFVKDGFHDYLIQGRKDAVNSKNFGTKVAPHYVLNLKPGESQVIRLRLYCGDEIPAHQDTSSFDNVFAIRIREADEFYNGHASPKLTDVERNVIRQGYAGLL